MSVVVALSLAVAGCGQLPRPFKADEGQGAESPLVALQDSAGIVVVPVFGAPSPVAGPLADIMAEGFRQTNIPATTGSAIKNAYLLEGEAKFTPAQGDIGVVTVDWTVSDSEGEVVERLTTKQEVPAAAWQSGARVQLNALSANAVPKIAGILQKNTPSAAEIAARPTIGVVAVEGAPGDGNEALKKAFEAVLKSAGVPVAPDPKLAAIQVFGKVDVASQSEGVDKIAIEWVLRKPDGSEIGVLKQNNTIKNGQASAEWGPLAYDVTFAMIDSIADILQTMERADDIRLGR
ncbi:MAG: hypothetical protein GKS00_07565 [Alphaproteobacteria bacterium]|nr:hypothetical protein [Alphaproteobacteria bacterium]